MRIVLNRASQIVDPLVAIARKARAALGNSRLYKDTRGAVAIYVAVTGALLVGGGVLAIDVGRMVVVRAELQNAADAAALSAALQLNGTDGARARAMLVVTNVIALESQLVEGSGAITATITNADFFEYYDVASGVTDVAEGDADAHYVRVVLDSQQLNFLLTGVLELVSSAGQKEFANMTTYAVAEYLPTTCEPVMLMTCDIPGSGKSVTDQKNAGRQYTLKTPAGAPFDQLSGNFGLLDMGTGAAAIRDALAGQAGSPCSADEEKVTKPGGTTGPVADGINMRLAYDPPGGTGDPNPATNVQEYPEDATLDTVNAGEIGRGDWDPNAYFNGPAHCNGGACTYALAVAPARGKIPKELADALDANANATWTPAIQAFLGPVTGDGYQAQLPTRYQTYLWEIGETFYIDGGRSWFPVPVAPDPLPGGTWTEVDPTALSAVQSAAGPEVINYTTDYGVGAQAASTMVPQTPHTGNTDYPDVEGGRVTDPALWNFFTNYCIDPAFDQGYCRVRHRTLLVVAVDCVLLDGKGKTNIDGAHDYARFFIIRKSVDPGPGAGDIIGELIGKEGTTGAGDELATGAITGNVRLID